MHTIPTTTINRIPREMPAQEGSPATLAGEEIAGKADTYTPGFPLTMSPRSTTAPAGMGKSTASPVIELPKWIEPWGELMSAASSGGNVLLDQGLKTGLEKAFAEMLTRGVCFSREKTIMLIETTRDLTTPRQIIADMENWMYGGFSVTVPGHLPFRLNNLRELAAVGQYAMGPQDLLKESLEHLAKAGFDKNLAESYTCTLGGIKLTMLFSPRGSDDMYRFETESVDEVLAVNALAGSGSLEGVADRGRLECLQVAIKQGWLDRETAFTIYKERGAKIPLTIDHKLPPVYVDQSAIASLETVKKTLTAYRDTYQAYLVPIVLKSGYERGTSFHSELYDYDNPVPIEVRIESFALMAAAGGFSRDIRNLHRELIGNSPRGINAIRHARAIAPLLRKNDIEGARRTLAELSKVDNEPDTDCYQALYSATGSHGAAREGARLVRIPTFCPNGVPESLEDRKDAYTRIALSLPDSDRDNTPEIYRDMLIHRSPDEPIAKAGTYMSSLISICAVTGCPMLAPILYRIMEKGPSGEIDSRIQLFETALITGSPLSDAIASVMPGNRMAEVIIEDDSITIDGITLDKNPDK